jgi:hypothetical protein
MTAFALGFLWWKLEEVMLEHSEEVGDDRRQSYVSLAERLGVNVIRLLKFLVKILPKMLI